MEIIKCEDCKWSSPIMQDGPRGRVDVVGYECRHNSPGEDGWPIVEVFDWCGEGRITA